MKTTLAILAALCAVLTLAACKSAPSAAGMTRAQITEKYQKNEISRDAYLALVADYERLHPQENAAAPDAKPSQPAPAAPMTPERAATRNQPILPVGVDSVNYNP